jgi:N-sulfoglucosamine sulfohydrolase
MSSRSPDKPKTIALSRQSTIHMKRRTNPLRLALMSLVLFSGLPAEAATKPNILFILTEDQGAQTGYLGTPGLQTPGMDSLARTGVSFNNAFVAYPVCSASKASIYTGLHNHTNGLLNNTENFHKPASELTPAERNKPIYANNRIHQELPTLVERLHEAGYYQGVTHKLHVSPNGKFPYDEFIKATSGAAVTAFIGRAKNAGKPWHLFYNISNSHRPYPNSDRIGIRVDPAAVKLPACLPDTPVVRKDWAEYLAGIEEADALTGQALEALKASGDADNTIVIFLGDHGPTFQHGKMTLYDLGLRTPLVIRAPGLKSGVQTDALASALDLTPTLLDLLELPPLPKTHGISLKPLLAGTADAKGHEFIFAEISDRGSLTKGMQERSVFDGRWKLIYRENLQPAWRQVNADSREFKTWGNRTYAETVKFKDKFPEPYRILTEMDPQNLGGKVPAVEFYDLKSDPDEMRNLAGDPATRPELKRLHAALRRWVDETSDAGVKPPADLPN